MIEITNHSLINSCVNYVPSKIVWTQSHDDNFNSSNYLIAGKYDINKKDQGITMHSYNESPEMNESSHSSPSYISDIASLPLRGNVLSLSFANKDTLLASTDEGNIYIVDLDSYQQEKPKMALHREFNSVSADKQSPLVAIDDCTNNLDREFASIDAETSSMTFYSITAEQTLNSIDAPSRRSCLTAFYAHSGVLCIANRWGEISFMDLREQHKCMSSSLDWDLSCLVQDPINCNNLMAGFDSGKIQSLDKRKLGKPTNEYTRHYARVNDIKFNERLNNCMFSSCENGSLLLWSGAESTSFKMSLLLPDAYDFSVSNFDVDCSHDGTARLCIATDANELFVADNIIC